MRTLRRAVKELVTMGALVTLGQTTSDPDDEPVRRGAAWLTIQVVAAAAVLGVALLVRAALGDGDVTRGPGALALWAIPAVLLVVPFVVHVLARPSRPVLGVTAAVAVAAVVVLVALAVVVTWGVWAVYLTAVVAAVGAAVGLGLVSPAGPMTPEGRSGPP